MAKFTLIVIEKESLENGPYVFFCDSISEVRRWHDHIEECHTSEFRHFEYYLYSFIQEVE